MTTYANKQSAQQSDAVAADANEARNHSKALHLGHNGPQAAQLGALQAMADHSPHGQRLKTIQAMMVDSPRFHDQNRRMQASFGSAGTPSAAQTAQLQGTDIASLPGPVAQTASDEKRNDTGLPDKLKHGVEALSGLSLDNVKVHYNSSRPAQLNARAFAQGTDIHVAPGQEQHLSHEAWHVVQQSQGRVQPTMQMKESVVIHDDKPPEHEADVMGASAIAQGQAVQRKSYSQSVTVTEQITSADLNNWGEVRRKLGGVGKGGEAYAIGNRVNESLEALGLATSNTAMSGHMIPNRIGGAGNASNVRPWDSAFEGGTWETGVERKFDSALEAAKVGESIKYAVETDDMSAEKAQEIVDRSTSETEKAKDHHKARIQEIPLKVSATVGAETLASTDECFKDLIKEDAG